MANRQRRFWLVTLLVFAGLGVLLYAGGAIHWNREPPYELALSWGGKGSEPGKFNDPTGIAVTAGEVFVADARNKRIQIFDKQGNFKRSFGQDKLQRPMNLEIAGNLLYVPDYFKDVIHVLTPTGDYERAIEAEDGFDSPGGIAVRPDGSLLVADTYNQRVVHIDANGKVLRVWGTPGEVGARAGTFSYPTDVARGVDSSFYVADGYNDRVQQFGPDGEFARKWGGPFAMNIFGPFKGWFATASSVAIGPNGAVFVADFYNDRIQKFTTEGKFLTAFGTPSGESGQSEIAVAVDADGTVWTANFADNRVEKWRPATVMSRSR